MPEIINAETALARLKAVAAERPDFITDSSCVYFSRLTEKPHCLVGVAFAEELTAAGVSVDRHNASAIERLAEVVPLPFTAKALAVLGRAQRWQDGSGTWGTAVEEAEKALAVTDYYDDSAPSFA